MSDVVDKAEAWDAAVAVPPKARAHIAALEAKLVQLSKFCSERKRECELLWQAIDHIDTSDPQLARQACERFGLDIDKAALVDATKLERTS